MPSSTKAAARTTEENGGHPLPAPSLTHDLEAACRPYVDAFFHHLAHQPRQQQPPASLQARTSTNSNGAGAALLGDARKRSLPPDSAFSIFAAPDALVRECCQLIEAAVAHGGAAASTTMRSAVELGAENVYLRAVLARMLQQLPPPQQSSLRTVPGVREAPAPASRLSPHAETHLGTPVRTVHVDGASDARRSPSAACPDPIEHTTLSAGTLHRAVAARKTCLVTDPREESQATVGQVGELQEQIELLREAVQELSQQASLARAYSASPQPAESRAAPSFTMRAVSPSPRCATPTCTTDVPTLQRIILHQQQTIRTLQLEMEEVASAKVQIEQLLHLHAAAATASDSERTAPTAPSALCEEGNENDDEDTPCLAATTHWRSTCHTDGCASDAAPHPFSPVQGSRSVEGHDEAAPAAAEDLYRMDFDAAVEMASEKRRAATYGGTRPPTWFDPAVCIDGPIELPGARGARRGAGAGEEDEEDEEYGTGTGDDVPSSGMRTPLPRGTVVLHPLQMHFSSATRDNASVTGGGMEESPVMRPTKPSYGSGSNRHTSVLGSFTAP